jgi:hypothetical protein
MDRAHTLLEGTAALATQAPSRSGDVRREMAPDVPPPPEAAGVAAGLPRAKVDPVQVDELLANLDRHLREAGMK